MRKRVKGSFTVEASLIIPLVLFIFCVSLYCLFYAHDKTVIGAAAYETVVEGSGRKSYDEEQLLSYFEERVEGRTFLFVNIDAKVEITEDTVFVRCEAKRKGMRILLERSMGFTEPENYIRRMRKLEKLNEELGEKE